MMKMTKPERSSIEKRQVTNVITVFTPENDPVLSWNSTPDIHIRGHLIRDVTLRTHTLDQQLYLDHWSSRQQSQSTAGSVCDVSVLQWLLLLSCRANCVLLATEQQHCQYSEDTGLQ